MNGRRAGQNSTLTLNVLLSCESSVTTEFRRGCPVLPTFQVGDYVEVLRRRRLHTNDRQTEACDDVKNCRSTQILESSDRRA